MSEQCIIGNGFEAVAQQFRPTQTSQEIFPVAQQSLDLYDICLHCIVFKLCMMKKETKKQRKKINNIEIFMFGFHHFEKG